MQEKQEECEIMHLLPFFSDFFVEAQEYAKGL